MVPRFADFFPSSFLSLISNLFAPFIAARVSVALFRHICYSSLNFELLFFGSRLPFPLPQSFVVFRLHERLLVVVILVLEACVLLLRGDSGLL
ncbi:hypothetical protein IGI04_005467, partial [Brassica rapa subsp. trilocularis]